MKTTKIKSGIVTESNAEYHGYKGAVSKSQLARMAVCPKYFKWCEDNPPEQSEEMVVGSAFHKLVLEPQDFGAEFVVMPEIDRRTKSGKESYMVFLQQAQGRQIITQEQYKTICGMRDSVLTTVEKVPALLKGVHEKSMYGIDKLTGECIKTRPDCYKIMGKGKEKNLTIVDFKSCRSAQENDFLNDVLKFHYDLQAYMYTKNASDLLDIPFENISFLFVAVEKKPPYLARDFETDEFVLRYGEMRYREYIGMYHRAKTTNNWWGLNGEYNVTKVLSLPAYLAKNL